ncbi:hypothetical protein V6N13_004554 [Hibiscus sabdariffa]|uniref:Uncharacterized protein n=1 Tax=Hibiscus sabdariffa TaxID=183260 RepID=A0ABR2RYU1_9ROSI
MSLQISECPQVNPRATKDGFPLLSGVSNGRLPDASELTLVMFRLESLANSVSEEDQQVMKKSRGEGGEVMDVGIGEINGSIQGQSVAAGNEGMNCDKNGVTVMSEDVQYKSSFCDMLTG